MDFLHDKHTKWFLVCMLCFMFLLFLADMFAGLSQERRMREMLFQQNRMVVASLLEQGVSESIVAKAMTNTQSSAQADVFLNKLGYTNSSRLVPQVVSFRQWLQAFTLIKCLVLSFLLLGILAFFLIIRERQYTNAIQTVTAYAKGDFSVKLPQGDGTVFRFFSCVNYLATALQSKQETEHRSKEFLKRTISDISHQLKTPLAALTMYNEIVLAEPDNKQTVQSFSQKTAAALGRMEQLIQSMLKITRLDAGGISFDKSVYRVAQVVARAVEDLTVRAGREQKALLFSGSQEDEIVCDLHWTAEAVGNIVKNALDHTGPDGKIHIVWEATPVMTRISVSDNGGGIAPEDLHHIFKRFYRTSSDRQGVGLGLPLAKAIIEGQGGIITVQSGLQKGTTFTITFLTKM